MLLKLIRIVLGCSFLTAAVVAQAEEGASSPTADSASPEEGVEVEKGGFVPPELVEYVEAEYPAAAMREGIEAEVLAELDVDENGLVVGVVIKEPVGRGFDEAAEDALYRFVFAPATKDGVPTPSKILFRYKFFLQENAEKEETPPPPLPAELSGKVTDMDGNPIPGASILFTYMTAEIPSEDASEEAVGPAPVSEAEELLQINANSKGAFKAKEITAGSYQLDIIAPGYQPLSISEDLEPGEIREVIYRLEHEDAMYETVVRARRPPREVTRREVTRREITRIPGTGGDALKSIQNMPGMARSAFGMGELIVRGSSPKDTLVFFDGMEVPLLYHFFGITSVINSDLLESIEFFPGNYSARYTGATGGIVEVYPKVPETDRLHAYVDANLMHASALVETPVGDKWSVAASVRRSYIDVIANALIPKSDGMSMTVAPRYYDYQLVADYHPDSKDKLNLFLFGSDDKMVFVFGNDVLDPAVSGGFDMRVLFHQFQTRWDHKLSSDISNSLQLGARYEMSDMGFGGIIDFEYDYVPITLREELSYDAKRNIAFRLGIDSQVIWTQWRVFAPLVEFGSEGTNPDPLSVDQDYGETSGDVVTFRPGWYGELELRPIKDLKLIGGLRFDYWHDLTELSMAPRFVARYQLFSKTALKGGVGLFYQSPEEHEYDEGFGNPDLGLINAMHYTIGVEQDITDVIEVGVEGFYKKMRNLVVTADDTRYNNEGTGQVYGLEFMLKHNPTDRFFGWVSYTLMKSERVDHPGDDPRRFDHDQTHILTVVASAVLGRGWEAGIRFRLVSGNPETPIVGSMFDADTDNYWPLYGATNSARLPTFHQLDVRVDKNWKWKYLKLAVYIDVQNIYNRKNPEGYQYNYDYSERQYFNGLPVLPILGFKLEH